MLTPYPSKSERQMKKYFFFSSSSLNDIASIPSISQRMCVKCVCVSQKRKKKNAILSKRAWHIFVYLPVFGVTAGWWPQHSYRCSMTLSDCVNWWEKCNERISRTEYMNLRCDYENRKATHTRARLLPSGCWCYHEAKVEICSINYFSMSSFFAVPPIFNSLTHWMHTLGANFATDYLSSKIKLRSHFSFDVILITY